MVQYSQSKIRVAIHVGSTAVHTAVGYMDSHHKLKIAAIGIANTDAFFAGQIFNHQHLLSAVHKSVREAVDMAKIQAFDAGLSYAMPQMVGENGVQHMTLTNDGKARQVTVDDMQTLFERATAELAAKDYAKVQLCSQVCWLDDDRTMQNAVGSYTHQLTVGYHLISVPSSCQMQMAELLSSNELTMYPSLMDSVAGAEYALTQDDKERGVCYIDIGAGTTSVCVYHQGMLLYSNCLAIGGQTVDLDVASELKMSLIEAEVLKRQHGSAYARYKPKGEFITLKKRSDGDEITINTHELSTIIQARYLDLLHQIFNDIQAKGLSEFMDTRVVLAGGASYMKDLDTLIEQNFGFSVRQISINPQVDICNKQLSDDNIKLLKEYIQSNRLHTVIGALLYQFSDKFAQDELSQYGEAPPAPVISKMQQLLKAFRSWL